MRKSLLIIVFLVAMAGAAAQFIRTMPEVKIGAADGNAAIGDCEALREKLAACEPFECSMPHPSVADFTVTHTVKEADAKGRCHHEQTVAEGGRVYCVYEPATKALVLKTLNPEEAPLNESEQAALAMAFTKECVVMEK